ncbi:Uma2 family endonuclease [Micromonospora carbonacea]|uniref:Putative restriction endonuclease n=1 Tax=Micromonospora carbonacea TaxID=47853 RepID=A0A1C4WBM1_9ACTN|nr:Uma2 family endonuclease [Micromonospora carbonacea]SCE93574.1 Putative restriction endonuclease [Micromonospora carbonacea]
MTAAPILPERHEWTVDDLGDLPKPVPVEDALLAVEVVSPTSTFRDMYDKAKVYARAGVQSYWVVDPLQERVTLTEYALAAGGREYE